MIGEYIRKRIGEECEEKRGGSRMGKKECEEKRGWEQDGLGWVRRNAKI